MRSVGIEARLAPSSDAQTLALGSRHASGEECLPHKVTLGDYLKICEQSGFDAKKTAFLMPTAHGPCRFGQYAPYLRRMLEELGYGDALVFSASSDDGYDGFGDAAPALVRTMYMGILLGDLVQKLLLKTRPYETQPGAADQAFEDSLADLEGVMLIPGLSVKQRLRSLVECVHGIRDRFRRVPAKYVRGRPLIGLVGEIYCRLNNFSNQDCARRIERLGGECWLSDIGEWIWYTNWHQENVTTRDSGRFSAAYLKFLVKAHVQHRYEKALFAPAMEDLRGYEEPHSVNEVLDYAKPYLPPEGCLGEMVLSVGKSVYLQKKGADGILDISPFTCMNGIICEAVYPALSAAHDNLPIRMAYFDGVDTNVDRDLEIFLDLARSYQKRKKYQRAYPACFE
jgi:predicted nucleotide-binding protein (sugar kinase/HSP70/actin superfamily)